MSGYQRRSFQALAALLCGCALTQAGAQPGAGLNPIIQPQGITRLTTHTWEIPDNGAGFVPNVGIVVGSEATLIIDTGLGERNGRIILKAARELSENARFYITATHYHPEHDLGAGAFPDDALLVRWAQQQSEADEFGATTIERFSGFAPMVAELLEDVSYRPADIVFPDEIRLDLGGVHVRIIGVGPNHTIGDTAFFVEEDRVLFAGDVVMPVFPSASAQFGDIGKWLENMREFEALNPAIVVPAHGPVRDVGAVRLYSDYLRAVRDTATTLASSAHTSDADLASAAAELAARFPRLQPDGGNPTGRIVAALRMALRSP
jgi:glyoxylase-like metal-dependent hydrolase (beta-lactamase superfamily II)